MLTETEQSAIEQVKAIGACLNDSVKVTSQEKVEAAIAGAQLALILQKVSDENEGKFGDEFYIEFAKATPLHLREIFLFGSINGIAIALENS